MRFEQVRSLLDHTRELHGRLAERYEALSAESERERLRMILDYAAHVERTIAHGLEHYEEGASRLVLDTWLDCAAGGPLADVLEGLDDASELSVEDVLTRALQVHEQVVAAYQAIDPGQVPGEVADVLEDVVRLEQAQGRRLALAAGQMSDL